MKPLKNVEVLKFEKNNIPKPYESIEKSDDKFVTYGFNNLYPNFLLQLYNDSPIHSSIINAKTTYIIGDGLKFEDGTDLTFQVNPSDTIKEFADKIVKDYLIFNYFAVEVIYNVFAEPIEYHHVPAHKIRMNKSKTKFWFNEDWYMSPRKTIIYDRWKPKNTDTVSKIFFFDGYFPSVSNVYAQPEYNGSIKSIVTGIEIQKFNLNNIENSFSVSTIISFFEGANLPDEQKQLIIDDIKAAYTGSEGKKFIIDFQSAQGKPAEVKQLAANDWYQAYDLLKQSVNDDIFIGHSVTSPMLLGVKTPGQIGGNTELETAYEIFKKTYVIVKRDEIESALNQLFTGNNSVTQKISFVDSPLFAAKVSDAVLEQVMTINEIRKQAGLQERPDGDRLLVDSQPKQPAFPQGQQMPTMNPSGSTMPDMIPAPEKKKLTEADYELIAHMGSSVNDFEIVSDLHVEIENELSGVTYKKMSFGVSEDVADYVIKNDIKNLTISELNKLIRKEIDVKITDASLKNILNKLNDAGVVRVLIDDGGNVEVKPSTTSDVPPSDRVTVMYKYIKRPEVEGDVLIPTSRSFCVKLIENGRLYTRAEIQEMSSIFGYNVYDYAGGFYYNPDTQETTPWCRHTWSAISVRPKRS